MEKHRELWAYAISIIWSEKAQGQSLCSQLAMVLNGEYEIVHKEDQQLEMAMLEGQIM